jgi:hypothetical protein
VTSTDGHSTVSPTDFLEQLAKELTDKPEVDADLAQILADHVLNPNSKSDDGLARARKAIADLAHARAETVRRGSGDV